jgi:hypothetical protein
MTEDRQASVGLLPDLFRLHERNGLSPNIVRDLADAATVCLARHHVSPTRFELTNSKDGLLYLYELEWPTPDERTRRSWANHDDATRDGAYSLVLAAAEAFLGLIAIGRTETRSGADWWLVPIGSGLDLDSELDYEDAVRLEVSGMGRISGEKAVFRRLSDKTEQARAGGAGPAIAGVAAFELRRVAFRTV